MVNQYELYRLYKNYMVYRCIYKVIFLKKKCTENENYCNFCLNIGKRLQGKCDIAGCKLNWCLLPSCSM